LRYLLLREKEKEGRKEGEKEGRGKYLASPAKDGGEGERKKRRERKKRKGTKDHRVFVGKVPLA